MPRIPNDAMRITGQQVDTRIAELLDLGQATTERDADELDDLVHLKGDVVEIRGEWDNETVIVSNEGFEAFAIDLAAMVYQMPNPDTWPYKHIDWKRAVRELQHEHYSNVEFRGDLYWVRDPD